MNQTVFLIGQCVSLRCALFPLNLGLPLHMQALASRHNPTLTTVAHCYNCLCKRQGLARTRTIAFPQHSCVLWYDGRTMEADNDNNSNEEEEDDDANYNHPEKTKDDQARSLAPILRCRSVSTFILSGCGRACVRDRVEN